MSRSTNLENTTNMVGLSERDARIVEGAGVAALIVVRELSELGPIPDDSVLLEGMPRGWDPQYWLYSQQLGCS